MCRAMPYPEEMPLLNSPAGTLGSSTQGFEGPDRCVGRLTNAIQLGYYFNPLLSRLDEGRG